MSWIFFVLMQIGDKDTAYRDSLNNCWSFYLHHQNTGTWYPFSWKVFWITLACAAFCLPSHVTVVLNPSIVPTGQGWRFDFMALLAWPVTWPRSATSAASPLPVPCALLTSSLVFGLGRPLLRQLSHECWGFGTSTQLGGGGHMQPGLREATCNCQLD